MRTGLTNMMIGVFIAAVGALVTGFTYSLVSHGGGHYVVAYGAIVVGVWRFLLGLFQVLRAAVGGSDVAAPTSAPTRLPSRSDTSSRFATSAGTAAPERFDTQGDPKAPRTIGWVLIAEAALRTISLGFSLLSFSVAVFFKSALFGVTALVVPAALAAGAVTAGFLLLRSRPGAIPFALVLCAVGLIFEAYVLARLLSVSAFHVSWFTWTSIVVHTATYIAGLIVLVPSSGRQKVLRGATG